MKSTHLVLIFAVLSLVVMIVVDFLMGEKAEFINAFSVLQRILGQQPAVRDSMAADKLGYAGEFGAVLFLNLVIGGILTAVVQFVSRIKQV